MKLTTYLQQREVGFVPKGKRLRSTNKSEILIEKQSVCSLKNTPCKLSGQTRATFLVDFSRDRTKVASTHGDHTVRVSDIVTGKCLHTLVGHPRTPWCVAFHPSSNDILASGCLGGDVRIWDLHGGGSEVWHAPNNAVIASLTFHPTDHVLLFATTNTVYFWDWSQPKPFAVCSTSMEYERVRWLGFDPLGQYIYTGITNVSNTHREETPNVVHIRNPTGHNPNSQTQNSWSRYQNLVERFHSYQQDRSRNLDDDDDDEDATIPSRLSPVHVDSIQLARQYAAEVTAASGRSRHHDRTSSRPPHPPGRHSPLPVNFLWDMGEDRIPASQHRQRMFSEFRNRNWSPPPRPSSEDDDALVEEEIDRLNRSIVRHSGRERSRPRYTVGSSHRTRSDRAQRRLAILTAFLRYRERNREPSGSSLRSHPPPRLIDRLNHINEEIQQVISSALDQPNTTSSESSSLSAPPSLFSAVPRVTPGFPPARRVGQRAATIVSPSRLASTSSIMSSTVNASSSSSSSRPPRGAASVARIFERRLINGCLTGHDNLDNRQRSDDNLVVQRQSDEQNRSRERTLFVDQPLSAPLGQSTETTRDNSCSRTRSQNSLSSWRHRPLSSFYPRPRSSRRFALSRTPVPESLADNSEASQSRIHTLPNTPNLFSRTTLPVTTSATSSLFSPNRFGFGSLNEAGSGAAPSPSRRNRRCPLTRTRTVVTDQTSQTTGAMNHPECLDQGTDVIGLDRVGPSDQELEELLMDEESEVEHPDFLSYVSDTITDGSMDEANVSEQEGDTDVRRSELNRASTSRGSGDDLFGEDIDLETRQTPSAVVPPSGSSHGDSTSSSDLASVSSLCQFVNHYNHTSPINITSRLSQSRSTELRLSQSRSTESILSQSRSTEPRPMEPRSSEQRSTMSVLAESGLAGPGLAESGLTVSGLAESGLTESRSDNRTNDINNLDVESEILPHIPSETASQSTRDEENNSNLLSSLGLTPTLSTVSNTVDVSSTPSTSNQEEASAVQTDSENGAATSSDSTNPCPAHAVLRHHAYLANATARLERRILELDERIGRSTSTISSLVLNRREDLASITARLERQVSELDERINALRASFTERLNALHEDRDRILTIQGQLTEQPSTAISSSLPIITITTPQDNNTPVTTTSLPSSTSTIPSFQSNTSSERGSRRRRNNNRILEAFLRDEPGLNPPSSRSNSRHVNLPLDNTNAPSEADSWHSLQQVHLHPHYSSSILDDTINRPNDALQAAINRAIAGAFMGTGEYAFANNIVPQSYRIQWWDFRNYQIPDLTNSKCNVIVPMCKLHNDASCDISQDGKRLATFVPSHRGFPDDNIMAVFSLEPHNFSQCLYTKSFGPNAISISISPKNEHVIIGLAAKRLSWVFSTHQLVAQIYQLKEVNAGEESMKHVTDVFHKCDTDVRTHVSVNAARWLPRIGEGIIYGTNRGDLIICRPCSSIITQKAESDESLSGSISDSDGGESMNPIRRNLMNFFLTDRTTTPQTFTTSTQTISGGIRRTAGTQTSTSAPLDMSMLLL